MDGWTDRCSAQYGRWNHYQIPQQKTRAAAVAPCEETGRRYCPLKKMGKEKKIHQPKEEGAARRRTRKRRRKAGCRPSLVSLHPCNFSSFGTFLNVQRIHTYTYIYIYIQNKLHHAGPISIPPTSFPIPPPSSLPTTSTTAGQPSTPVVVEAPFYDRLDAYADFDFNDRNLWLYVDEAGFLTPALQLLLGSNGAAAAAAAAGNNSNNSSNSTAAAASGSGGVSAVTASSSSSSLSTAAAAATTAAGGCGAWANVLKTAKVESHLDEHLHV